MTGFSDLDEMTLDLICRQLIDQNDYVSLLHLSQTCHKFNLICQKFFDPFNDAKILLLISRLPDEDDFCDCTYHAPKLEDASPVMLITLDKLYWFILNHPRQIKKYFLSLVRPNQLLKNEGGFVLEFCREDYVWVNQFGYDLKDLESNATIIRLIKRRVQKFLF